MIASRMAKPNGRGSWMVYKNCDREYAEQVTAEHKVNVKTGGGRVKQVWVKKTSHADNHYLDAEVYAFAAADVLHVRNIHLMLEDENEKVNEVPQVNKQSMDFNNAWLKNIEWF
jgi:hypothetical protein